MSGKEYGKGASSKVEEKIPQPLRSAQARDEAGKDVGVNGRYVDMASDVHLVDQAIQFVMRTNKRRNMNSGQWATVAVEAEDVIRGIAEQVEKERREKISSARLAQTEQKIVQSQSTPSATATKADSNVSWRQPVLHPGIDAKNFAPRGLSLGKPT